MYRYFIFDKNPLDVKGYDPWHTRFNNLKTILRYLKFNLDTPIFSKMDLIFCLSTNSKQRWFSYFEKWLKKSK